MAHFGPAHALPDSHLSWDRPLQPLAFDHRVNGRPAELHPHEAHSRVEYKVGDRHKQEGGEPECRNPEKLVAYPVVRRREPVHRGINNHKAEEIDLRSGQHGGRSGLEGVG